MLQRWMGARMDKEKQTKSKEQHWKTMKNIEQQRKAKKKLRKTTNLLFNKKQVKIQIKAGRKNAQRSEVLKPRYLSQVFQDFRSPEVVP